MGYLVRAFIIVPRYMKADPAAAMLHIVGKSGSLCGRGRKKVQPYHHLVFAQYCGIHIGPVAGGIKPEMFFSCQLFEIYYGIIGKVNMIGLYPGIKKGQHFEFCGRSGNSCGARQQ